MNKLIISIVLGLTLIGCTRSPGFLTTFHDDTDPPNGASGLRIYIDYKSGCQYLSSDTGGLTPRLDIEGKVMCGKNN